MEAENTAVTTYKVTDCGDVVTRGSFSATVLLMYADEVDRSHLSWATAASSCGRPDVMPGELTG